MWRQNSIILGPTTIVEDTEKCPLECGQPLRDLYNHLRCTGTHTHIYIYVYVCILVGLVVGFCVRSIRVPLCAIKSTAWNTPNYTYIHIHTVSDSATIHFGQPNISKKTTSNPSKVHNKKGYEMCYMHI